MGVVTVTYTVNSFDDSASGMERLRYQSEFILLAYPHKDSDCADIRQQWLDDIQSCCHPDGFDYEAASAAVNEWCDYNGERISHALGALHREGFALCEEYECEGPVFRLYIETGDS